MAERSKALRLERSPVLWAWVQIPLLTKFIFCNYDNYCLQYHAGRSHLSRILKLLKSWIFSSIVVSQDGRAVQGAAPWTLGLERSPVLWAWVQIPLLTKI